MVNLILKEIDKDFEDIDKVYTLNNEAFPKEERIDNSKFLTIVEACKAQAQALYDGDKFVGFVVGSYSKEYELYYIWFLAIESQLRGLGYGSKALDTICHRYPNAQIVVEIEVLNPSCLDYEDRVRRYNFYHKNGFEKSNWAVSYFGADFQIISRPFPFRKEEYETFWNALWPTKAPSLYSLNV